MVNFPPKFCCTVPKGREVQEQEAEVPAADRRAGDHEREHPFAGGGAGEGEAERQEPESRQGQGQTTATATAAGALNSHTAEFEAQNASDHFFRIAIEEVDNASAGEARGTCDETTCSNCSGKCETPRQNYC